MATKKVMNLEEGDIIVAIDVGKGTEDVMVHRVGTNFENSIQLVMPSMTQIIYNRILKHRKETLKIAGDLMAGEPWNKLVYGWEGRVVMTKTAAMSLKYNLEYLKQKGIEIVDFLERPDIRLSDVGWKRLKSVLRDSEISFDQIKTILICAQEHGNPPKGVSVKDFRMKGIWGNSTSFPDYLMGGKNVPDHAPRLQSLVESAVREFPHLTKDAVYVMDSAAAVLAGACNFDQEELVVNVGNGHVSAVHHKKGEILYVYESHTGRFNYRQFLLHMQAIYEGTLTHQEVIRSGGHGLKIMKPEKVTRSQVPKNMIVLGPNRKKVTSSQVIWSHPIGNMMMAGPFGLIRCLYSICKNNA